MALSSAEAELYAIGSGICESLHIRSVLLESGIASKVNLTVFTDSSSAKTVSSAFGTTRKTRHVQLKYLFMQNLIHQGIVRMRKVRGDLNPSDILTKGVKPETLRSLLHHFGITAEEQYEEFDEEFILVP